VAPGHRRRSHRPRGGRAVRLHPLLQWQRAAGIVAVAGHIPVLFADYNIQNPSFAGFVTTQDHGLLEFLLVFNKA
jgi:hypothetical protein